VVDITHTITRRYMGSFIVFRPRVLEPARNYRAILPLDDLPKASILGGKILRVNTNTFFKTYFATQSVRKDVRVIII